MSVEPETVVMGRQPDGSWLRINPNDVALWEEAAEFVPLSALRSVEGELRLERDLRRRAERSRENANAVSLRVEGENRRLSEELRQAREERNAIAGLYNAMQSAREQLTEERDRAVGEVFDTRDSLDAAEADRDRLAGALRHARGCITEQIGPMPTPSQRLALDTIEAALSPVQGEHEQDGDTK